MSESGASGRVEGAKERSFALEGAFVAVALGVGLIIGSAHGIAAGLGAALFTGGVEVIAFAATVAAYKLKLWR